MYFFLNTSAQPPFLEFSIRQHNFAASLNGDFDPSNAYLLAINENLETSDFHGKWIWKLQTLPKI